MKNKLNVYYCKRNKEILLFNEYSIGVRYGVNFFKVMILFDFRENIRKIGIIFDRWGNWVLKLVGEYLEIWIKIIRI